MTHHAQIGLGLPLAGSPLARTSIDSARPGRAQARRGASGMTSRPSEEITQADAHAADRLLVQRALTREPRAVDELVTRLACTPAMLRVLQRQLGARLRPDELADIEQSILGALWSKLSAYEGRAALETWAFRFVQLELHKALDRRRRSARLTLVDGERLEVLPCAEPGAPQIEPATLRACVERLGSPTCEIVSMRHYDELSFEEIARQRGEALSAVKGRYYRGLERLKALLEPHLRRQL